MIKEVADGLTVQIKVQPRSSRNMLLLQPNGEIKAYLNAPPVDGAANIACINLLAEFSGLSKSNVQLLSGIKSRQKVFKIYGITKQTFEANLLVKDKN